MLGQWVEVDLDAVASDIDDLPAETNVRAQVRRLCEGLEQTVAQLGTDLRTPEWEVFAAEQLPEPDDDEGTLGGLVSLAEPASLVRLTRRALSDARHCSSDPLCAERLPHARADFLHGAVCHVCLFISETTCERGNRFLDRRFVVPIDGPAFALFPELP